MKTKTFINEDDPDRNEQEITFVRMIGEGFQARVFIVEFEGQQYAAKMVGWTRSSIYN